MATWSAWFPDVLVHVPGAPNPTIEVALCRAAREFFRRTRAWMAWLDPATTLAGDNLEYDFDLPADTDVVRLERATVGGTPLGLMPWRQIKADPVQHDVGERGLLSGDLLAFRLPGTFAAGEQVQALVSLMPTLAAADIPDELADRYREVIAEGAKAQLLVIPSTTFHNPPAAAIAKAEFERGIAQHAVDVFRSHTSQMPRAAVAWC